MDKKAMLNAYVACALWSSTDDNGIPLDSREELSIAFSTLEYMNQEIQDFLLLLDNEGIHWQDHMTDEQFAHDFWLTRNGHGAGFWDRGYGDLGEQLTKWSKTYGSCDLYIGDDNHIYMA